MDIGDMVKIVNCDVCPDVVGKIVEIKKINPNDQEVELKFGRGRPKKNRPETFKMGDLCLVGK